MKTVDLARDFDYQNLEENGVKRQKLQGKFGLFREDFTLFSDEYKKYGIAAGKYISIENIFPFENEEKFDYLIKAISSAMFEFVKGEQFQNILVVGLGNRKILTDALGSLVLDNILVTRHNKNELETELKRKVRCVSTLFPMVEGVTGIKSNEVVKSVVSHIKPNLVIVIDALSSKDKESVLNVLQFTDTGISAGSAKKFDPENVLSEKSLKTKVISVGVPLLSLQEGEGALITTRDALDVHLKIISNAIAMGINLALFDFLSLEDVKELAH